MSPAKGASDQPRGKPSPACPRVGHRTPVGRKTAPPEGATSTSQARFETLDFDVFSNGKWDRLQESHAKDILVHWPDGHTTTGIEKHIEDLKAMFVYAPDTKIAEHPIRTGSGEWTAVTGIMTGTISKPMPIEPLAKTTLLGVRRIP